MPFKNILVALDGSRFSEWAAQFGFLFASKLNASLTGQHVVDPRMAELFIEPEFAAELGIEITNETTDKVISGLHKFGAIILKLFVQEAKKHSLNVNVVHDEGYVVFEVMKRLPAHDLIIVGHRGPGDRTLSNEMTIGSTAERIVTSSSIPVLVAASSPASVEQIMVAFDGSEPSLGALLMAEQLAKNVGLPLKATYISRSAETMEEAKYAVIQGEQYLKEKYEEPVFSIDTGMPAEVLLEQAERTNSLLVLGAYGFRNKDELVMGTTATQVLRKSRSSMLIYR